MSSWESLMENLDAVQDQSGEVLHFGTPPTGDDTGLLAVADHLAVIRVAGEDAETFLQGQVSADIRPVSQGGTCSAMHLSLKGRGLVSMRILPAPEQGFLLVLPRALVEACLAQLRKFVLMAKVTLEPDPDAAVLVLTGARASENLLAASLEPPAEAGQAIPAGNTVLACTGTHRRLLVAPESEATNLWPTLADGLTPGGSLHARLDEIFAGEGHVYPGGEDRFMPQELNYDLIGGVSFKKGCYVGQEVVARMHFKGKLKQRMRHLSWAEAGNSPQTGDFLRNDGGKAVGEVVQALNAGGRCHALVVLRHSHEGPLYLDDNALDWHMETLPYELPEE